MSRPFDEARYKGLLEGLEVSEIPILVATASDRTGRFDSSYFNKEQLWLREKAKVWPKLGTYTSRIVCGPFGSTILDTNYQKSGVPMLRPFNLRELRSDVGDIVYLSPEFVLTQNLKIFKRDDLAFARVGDVGCGMIIQAEATISPNVIVASISDSTLNPYYATVFFNTKYGRLQMEGAIKAVAQPTISTEIIRELRIPLLSESLQTSIQQALERSETAFDGAKTAMIQAEQTLLRALGLQDWQPPEPLTYTRRAADVFSAARFDAEYFNPAKQLVIETLSSGPYRRLGDHVRSIRDMFVPGTPCAFAKVRNYDLTDALKPVLDSTLLPIPISEVGSTKKQFQNGDVVISRLRSYLKEIAIVRVSDGIPVMGSSEFIVLRPQIVGNTQLSPELLSTYLRSQPVQTILKSCVDGSQHPRFSEGDLLSIPVPDAILASAEEIDTLIGAAEFARVRAQQMLNAAKRAVEIAIEQGEAEALAYLRKHGAEP